MLRFVTIFTVLGLLCHSINGDTIDKVPAVLQCYSKCSGESLLACQKGCKFAYALTFAPEDYAHNASCEDSCKDMYSDKKEREACFRGCGYYGGEVIHVKLSGGDDDSQISSFFSQRIQALSERLRQLIGGSPDSDDSTAVKQTGDEESFITRTMSEMMKRMHNAFSSSDGDSDETSIHARFRIFFMARPNEDNTEEDSKTTTEKANKPSQPVEKRVISAKVHGFCRRFVDGVQRVFTSPFNILLALTLFGVILLFVAQLAFFLRRRSRRQRGSGYTRLPTYAEAVEVKVPLMSDSFDEFAVPEKTKAAENDAKA